MKALTNLIKSSNQRFLGVCQCVGAKIYGNSQAQIQLLLFALGCAVLALGLQKYSFAQSTGEQAVLADHGLTFTDDRIAQAVVGIFTMIEGSFGALVMVCSGVAAILGSAFGQYRSALGCLVVAVGSFILRSVTETFFNMESTHDRSGF